MDAKQMVNGITGAIGACLLFFGGMWLLANYPLVFLALCLGIWFYKQAES